MAALVLALVSVLLTSDPSSGDHSSDVRCLSCEDVTSPDLCMTSEQCALDEVCFTREIFDHQGHRGFRLGCEHRDFCQYGSIGYVIGRRAESDVGRQDVNADVTTDSQGQQGPILCFRCCASDDCNSALCSEAVGVNKTDQGSHLGTPSHCPPGFDKGPNSCLYFSTTQLSWLDARAACERLGASLVKVEDREEDLFILQKLKALPNTPSSWGYAMGGHYDRFSDEARWLDGSVVRYTRWGPGMPDLNWSVMFFVSPAANPAFPNFEWATGGHMGPFGYVCESRG